MTMTKRTESGEVIQIRSRDLVRTPLGVVLMLLATGGTATGMIAKLGIATRDDVSKVQACVEQIDRRLLTIEKQMADIGHERDLEKLIREWRGAANVEPPKNGT